MNELQKTYAIAKAAYDAAFEAKNWDLVDKLEDPYIDAELALMDWAFAVVIATGKMTKEDTDFLRRNANGEKWDNLVNMAFRLKA